MERTHLPLSDWYVQIFRTKNSLQNHEQLTLLLRPLRIRIEHRPTWQLCETQVQPTHRRTCTSEHQRTWRQTKSLAESNCDKKTLDWTLHFLFVLRCKVKSKPTIRFPFLLFSHSSKLDKQTKKMVDKQKNPWKDIVPVYSGLLSKRLNIIITFPGTGSKWRSFWHGWKRYGIK